MTVLEWPEKEEINRKVSVLSFKKKERISKFFFLITTTELALAHGCTLASAGKLYLGTFLTS